MKHENIHILRLLAVAYAIRFTFIYQSIEPHVPISKVEAALWLPWIFFGFTVWLWEEKELLLLRATSRNNARNSLPKATPLLP